MINNPTVFAQALKGLQTDAARASLRGIKHGVEREALRITPNGQLSQTPHPTSLGSALTHDTITTDFSEALLEFITPPESDPAVTLQQLYDIHKFTLAQMGDEALWPMSMPCYVNGESRIPIADYGTSNVGRMKKTYRVGLKNRYGAMMQAIAGIHFNFSLPEAFWEHFATIRGEQNNIEFQSQSYFNLIRNYRRWCWLIPFLYGSSPAICGSFLQGKNTKFDFQKLGKGTLYLPYATSLRMSDLGYTNSQQSALRICYNNLPDYIQSVRSAIRTHSTEYERFAAGEQGIYEQLNRNILQIENELYSPIRPKQVARSMEKPTDALADRGVSYIEVRALDVNPFTPVGIEEQQFYFLDVFLLTCLLADSPEFDETSYAETESNLKRVVTDGRNPALTLILRDGENVEEVALQEWGESLFGAFMQTAQLLDEASGTDRFSVAVEAERDKLRESNKTPSARWLNRLLQEEKDNGQLGLQLSQEYKSAFANHKYTHFTLADFERATVESQSAQKAIEEADSKPFDVFLKDYFSRSE
ncbi:glutamate--cysteine ligase [Alteromonas sp. ASW11-36]|uniref:Glutamate--cysteine ligase n=1 Tax=Alteromonas arenosi TaxID=3055817 RepID=A0ABT7SV55_9ALTE|nr:glutamate--cysteine ligase [Alteromonas sp. ASW11-36]MDM7860040.1 glutamate--cysteine ligase [Alteromonas sp. ASW11-36]